MSSIFGVKEGKIEMDEIVPEKIYLADQMEKLKKRWGIRSNLQLAVIFIVFAITGSVSAKLAEPLVHILGIHKGQTAAWIYWPARILLIFPIYQVLLVFFGWLFGQYEFFWNFEKKMLRRLGLGRFIN